MGKPVLTERGKKVLARVLAAMRKYPSTVDMGEWYWHDPLVKSTRRRPAPYCGTVACLAGHIALAATGRRPDRDEFYEALRLPKRLRNAKDPNSVHCSRVALAALELPGGDWADTQFKLFFGRNWPESFKIPLFRPGATTRQRAATVIARVRYWLKTGE